MREYNKHKFIYIETHGCQMNEFDSERIKFILENDGYIQTENIENSDIVIINTCAVRKKAENKLFGHIGNLKKLKLKNPELIIAIGGCAAQSLKNKIIESFPFVDIVFGTNNLQSINKLIKKRLKLKRSICETIDYLDHLKNCKSQNYEDFFNFKNTYKFKAFLPIMIGCNNFCSYCIVPYVRGPERSIPPEKILKKVDELVKAGVLDITLLGQNVNSYGMDLASLDSKMEINFSELLSLIAQTKDLKRLRFMTSHPKDFNDSLISVIKNYNNIMKHIHLPLQAGSDKILALMNRKYTKAQYINLYNKIKSTIPECNITTDIIVGFPGETVDDFKQTLELVETLKFNRAFTFIYSPRQNTLSANFPDPIPLSEKKKWFKELINVQNEISLKENSKLIGKNIEVLVEGYSTKDKKLENTCFTKNENFVNADNEDNVNEDNANREKNNLKSNNSSPKEIVMLEGRMDSNLIVNFKGDKRLIGSFVNVSIVKATPFYLEGKLLKNKCL